MRDPFPIRVLRFFGFLDQYDKISITNCTLFVCLLLLAILPSLHSLGAFMVTTASYMQKRFESNKSERMQIIDEEFSKIRNELSIIGFTLQDQKDELTKVKDLHAQVAKQAEEVRSNLQAINLSNSLNLQKRMR